MVDREAFGDSAAYACPLVAVESSLSLDRPVGPSVFNATPTPSWIFRADVMNRKPYSNTLPCAKVMGHKIFLILHEGDVARGTLDFVVLSTSFFVRYSRPSSHRCGSFL